MGKDYLVLIGLLFTIFMHLTNQEETLSPVPDHSQEEKGNDSKRIFTHEWQEIKDDEPIPPGLHIRINLTTGKKEVKLLDKEETTKTSVAVVDTAETLGPEEHVQPDLKSRLKNIPVEDVPSNSEEINDVKKRFRPYEELKKEFESLKMAVKTDLEVMNELFTSFQKVMEKSKDDSMAELGNLNILSPVEEAHLNILTDLEYMVHQVDNAKEFVLSGGLPLIVYPSLNSSSPVIRTEAARLLGSAVQNNAASQIKAVESGAVGTLLRVLALDSAASVRSAALYAVSCLVRRFPLAQRQFVDQGGFAVLASLFDGESGEQLKLQVKVITFIDDLLVERLDAEVTKLETTTNNNSSPESVEAKERLRQYQLINLQQTLQDNHWCQHLLRLFKRELLSKSTLSVEALFGENSLYTPDLDVVEKLTRAMVSLAKPCREEFLSDRHVEKLVLGLIRWLKKLSAEEEGESDGYYTGLADQVKLLGSLLGVFHTTHELPNLL